MHVLSCNNCYNYRRNCVWKRIVFYAEFDCIIAIQKQIGKKITLKHKNVI